MERLVDDRERSATLDYYAVLQVDPSADPEVIEAAYRQLMKKHHPDVAGLDLRLATQHHQRAKRINQAHSVLGDPDFAAIVAQDLRDGQHRNPTAKDYFTTTFFHRPDELRSGVIQAGFDLVELVGVEGPAWLLPDLERRWTDPEERERLLQAARAVEREPTLLGLHPHLLAVARRPLSEAG